MRASTGREKLGVGMSVAAALVSVTVGSVAAVLVATSSEGTGLAPVTAAVAATDGEIAGVNPGASGVNTGDKKQASGVKMHVQKPARIPKDSIGSGVTGGCVLGYGKGLNCLPTVPPGEIAHAQHAGSVADLSARWTCSQVWLLFPDGLEVNRAKDGVGSEGVDPLGLDSNRDGVACGEGDRD